MWATACKSVQQHPKGQSGPTARGAVLCATQPGGLGFGRDSMRDRRARDAASAAAIRPFGCGAGELASCHTPATLSKNAANAPGPNFRLPGLVKWTPYHVGLGSAGGGGWYRQHGSSSGRGVIISQRHQQQAGSDLVLAGSA